MNGPLPRSVVRGRRVAIVLLVVSMLIALCAIAGLLISFFSIMF